MGGVQTTEMEMQVEKIIRIRMGRREAWGGEICVGVGKGLY